MALIIRLLLTSIFLELVVGLTNDDPNNPLNLTVKSMTVYQIRSKCGLLNGKFHTAVIVTTEHPEMEIGIRMSNECGSDEPTRTFNADLIRYNPEWLMRLTRHLPFPVTVRDFISVGGKVFNAESQSDTKAVRRMLFSFTSSPYTEILNQ